MVSMNRALLGAFLVGALVAVLLLRSCGPSDSDDVARADSLARVITDSITPLIDSLRTSANSNTTRAEAGDLRLREAEAEAAERIRRASGRASAAEGEARVLRDSLAARLDSVGLSLAARADALTEERVDSLKAVILAHEERDVAQEASIVFWRTASQSKDPVIEELERRDVLRLGAQASLEREISRLNRRSRIIEGAGALLLGNAALCKVTGIGLAC